MIFTKNELRLLILGLAALIAEANKLPPITSKTIKEDCMDLKAKLKEMAR